MKQLILALALVTWAQFAVAGHDGNGGFGIQCSQPIKANNGTVLAPGIYTLDYWDAIHSLGYNWELGAKNLAWQQKIKIAASRLQRLNRELAASLVDLANNPNKYISMSTDKVYCGNTKISGEDIIQDVDIGSTIIPNQCKLIPLAKNVGGCPSEVVKLQKNIFINPKLFPLLNEDSKAALVMHEYFYLHGNNKGNSEKARLLVALLSRADFNQIDPEALKKLYKGIEIFPIDIKIHQYDFAEAVSPGRIHLGFDDDGKIKSAFSGSYKYVGSNVSLDYAGQKFLARPDHVHTYSFNKLYLLTDYKTEQRTQLRITANNGLSWAIDETDTHVSLQDKNDRIEDFYTKNKNLKIQTTNETPTKEDICLVRLRDYGFFNAITVGNFTFDDAYKVCLVNGNLQIKSASYKSPHSTLVKSDYHMTFLSQDQVLLEFYWSGNTRLHRNYILKNLVKDSKTLEKLLKGPKDYYKADLPQAVLSMDGALQCLTHFNKQDKKQSSWFDSKGKITKTVRDVSCVQL